MPTILCKAIGGYYEGETWVDSYPPAGTKRFVRPDPNPDVDEELEDIYILKIQRSETTYHALYHFNHRERRTAYDRRRAA